MVQLVEDRIVDYPTIKSVAEQISQESKSLDLRTHCFSSKVNEEIAHADCSETLLTLLSHISPKLSSSLIALLIRNMVTSVLTSKSTDQ